MEQPLLRPAVRFGTALEKARSLLGALVASRIVRIGGTRVAPALLLLLGLCFAQRRPVDRFPRGIPGVDWELRFDPDLFEEMGVRCQAARAPVVVYHDIVRAAGQGASSFDVTEAQFRRDLEFLRETGAHPISLRQLHEHLARGTALPPGAIALTFDDGYQGFADFAYPLLKQYGYPAAVFVHTAFVGDRSGDHPKMDWETLRRLDREGLVTIGSHTVTHPPDLRALSQFRQRMELANSRATLERHLGHSVRYLAYPEGNSDAVTRAIARRAGYTMAFSTSPGPAQESPGILCVNRYDCTELRDARLECDERARTVPAAVIDAPIRAEPVRLEVGVFAGIKMAFVRGGVPVTRRSPVRLSVGDFVYQAGGVAGINGTFFVDARILGTGADLIGPSRTGPDGPFLPEVDAYRLGVLSGRPLVLIGPRRIAIFPYQAGYLNCEAPFRSFMPDYTDLFLAGAWVVHRGVARTSEEMEQFGARDLSDPRRRAFFGLTADGEVVLGASLEVIRTSALARAAAAAGVEEAVLLDSGFSTSLVFGDRVIVTGHTAKNIPSRPVPHAIVLMGRLTPVTDPEVERYVREGMATLYEGRGDEERARRRRHRAEAEPAAGFPESPVAPEPSAPPDAGPPPPTGETTTSP